jgi:hypothetical protein
MREGNVPVDFTALHKFVVSAHTDDMALVEHNYLLTILDSGNTLGNNKDSTRTGMQFESSTQSGVGLEVEG